MRKLKQSDQWLRVGVLQNFDKVLLEKGHNADEVLRKEGLDSTILSQGDMLVSLSKIGRLLEVGTQITGDENFCLELAKKQDLSSLGMLGLLFQTSGTVEEFTKDLISFVHIHSQPVLWAICPPAQCGGLFGLSFDITNLEYPVRQYNFSVILGLAQCHRTLNEMTKFGLPLSSVQLKCSAPESTTSLQQYFGCAIEFNAETNALIYPESAKTTQIVNANRKTHDDLVNQISHQNADGEPHSLSHEVKALIRTLLPVGNCSIETVAQAYRCDKRTLQKHLREGEDISFREILEETRFELACQYLLISEMSMTQIAYAIGYQESSNFSRSFRSKFGLSPRQWQLKERLQQNIKPVKKLHLRGRI